MDTTKKSRWDTIILWLFILSFIIAIAASFHRYFFTKNYDYLVEASCDPTVEACFVRDCSTPDDCPPNGFSVYKEYNVRASDFAQCADNSCKEACESHAIQCTVVACDEEAGDTCSSPSTEGTTSIE